MRNTSQSQSVARALSILDLLEREGEGLGVREIARRLGVSPTIAQRLLTTLAGSGYVERATNGQSYRVGFRLFQVGRSYLAHNSLHSVCLPELRQLAEAHHVNAYLGVLRGNSVIYLEALQSKGPIAIVSTPGSAASLHSTAFGKALLAEREDAEVAQLLGPEPFKQMTRKTKTRLRPLLKELAEVRRHGFAVSDEENLDNVYAAGAVIRDASGAPIAAVSGAVPRSQLSTAAAKDLCNLVLEAARRISHKLGAPQRAPSLSSEKARKACV